MSKGLRFRKGDLHVHTPCSRCFEDKTVTPEDIVAAALEKDLDFIAITDHHHCEWIDRVKAAAEGSELVVFPGVEITGVNEYHIVAILDVGKGTADIETLLHRLDLNSDDFGRQTTICSKTLQEITARIRELGGLVVLPHIDDHRGAFLKLEGESRIQTFNSDAYDAVETINGELPPEFDSQSHVFLRIPAHYQASDNPDPNDHKKHSILGIGNRYSLFKLDEIHLEGLRQCFIDPEVRIKHMPFLDEVHHPVIKSIDISGGFLQNQAISFNSGLNCIIGGKGTGKSLIIEFIRFALGQATTIKELIQDHNDKISACLGTGHKVTVKIQGQTGTVYKIERFTNSTPTCLNETSGEIYEGSIPELFPILAYSQNEVMRLSNNPHAQLELIDNFVSTSEYERDIERLNTGLEENAKLVVEGLIAQNQLPGIQKDLSTINEKIREQDILLETENGTDSIKTEFKKLETKKLEFEGLTDSMVEMRQLVIGMKDSLGGFKLAQTSEALEGDLEIKKMAYLAKSHYEALNAFSEKLSESIDLSIDEAKSIINEWLPIYEAKRTEYHSTLRDNKVRVDAETEREKLNREKMELEKEIKGKQNKVDALNELLALRETLLDELDTAYKGIFDARKIVYQSITDGSNGKVQLELKQMADRERFYSLLFDLRKGTFLRENDVRKITTEMLPRQFVQAVLDKDHTSIEEIAGLTEDNAVKIIEHFWGMEKLKDLLKIPSTCYPEDIPAITFKVGRNYKGLDEISVGQKCTALIVIAMLMGDTPLIIDQPEDALDTKTVWDDISQTLRSKKLERQFILTTHNTTIAVSSDSDLIIQTSAGAIRGGAKSLGAIESAKDAAIQSLEGGKEPYRLRIEKYGE